MFFKRLGVNIEKVKIDYHKLSDEEMSALEKKEIFDVSYISILSSDHFQNVDRHL